MLEAAAMQPIEIGAAMLVGADDLGVDYDRHLDAPRLLDNDRVPVRPIGSVDRVEPHPSAPGVDLQPVSVVLDLMHPAFAAGRLLEHVLRSGGSRFGETYGYSQLASGSYHN